ncbi:MAG TPA: cupin [Candidatus Limnocylindria bacterium]|nr:cupin [Candidatus Limnocylindria bacterium]
MSARRKKGHIEFTQLLLDRGSAAGGGWQPIDGHAPGITQLVLADNLDPHTRTGSRTRLIHWAQATLLAQPVQHDYREEILILEGDLVVGCEPDGSGGTTFTELAFATRPAGVAHGPFTTREGCLMLELDLYD